MLPVGDIRPQRFEPEREAPGEAKEMLDLDGHFSKERLGNTTLYIRTYKYKISCFARLNLLLSGASVIIANHCQQQDSVFAAKKLIR